MTGAFDLTALAVGYVLVLTRVGAYVMACPVFVSERVAMKVRALLIGLLATSLYSAHPVQLTPEQPAIALVVEGLLGTMFGLCTRMVSLGVTFAGELMDTNIGFGFARILNPMMPEESGPVMNISQLLGGLLFFVVGGQHMVISGLSRSFEVFPAGHATFSNGWVTKLFDHFGDLLTCGVMLALPVMLALMVTQAGLALLSRVSPAMNVWAVGLMITCAMGMMCLWAFTPAWVHAICNVWLADGNGFMEVSL